MKEKNTPRIMVDMSATLLHHGHIRILKSAKALGTVIVALVTDEEVKMKKGYMPELCFAERKEILEAIRYVDEVIPAPWLVDENFLDQQDIDLLVHGEDNSNPVNPNRLVVLPRTQGVSSNALRVRSLEIIAEIMKEKLI